jgi:3-hydroxyacyl-[acyl-carrier-protein] dehydratase
LGISDVSNTKDLIVDLSQVNLDEVFADITEIRKYNPQRHEMEQLTAIIMVETERSVCLGYKDVLDTEFWVRGHMPGMPIMPGVVMCEAAAQLSSFYTQRFDLLGAEMVGFGGLEEVRFRDTVMPGDRFYISCQLLKARRNRMIICRFQGFVEDRMVVEGKIKGIPLPVSALQELRQQRNAGS